MAITFKDLTDVEKLQAADIVQKIEAIDGVIAAIQTERATAEAQWNGKEQVLLGEQAKLRVALRAIRQAEVTTEVK